MTSTENSVGMEGRASGPECAQSPYSERETGGLCELRALAEAASRGDWRAHITNRRSPEIYTNAPPANTPNPLIAGTILRKNDARFIAAANPETVIALLNEREAQTADLERLRGALESIRDAISTKYDQVARTSYNAGTPGERNKEGRLQGLNDALAIVLVCEEEAARALKTEGTSA